MKTDKVTMNPTPDDLLLRGPLLSIVVHYTSFEVKSQPGLTFAVQTDIFPIRYIKEFFRVNGSEENPRAAIAIRPAEILEEGYV